MIRSRTDGQSSDGRTRIVLVVMPVVEVNRTVLGVTQLRSVVESRFGDRLSVEVRYLNHDFAAYVSEGERPGGRDFHELVLQNQYVGLPDWMFRHVAFPELEDNATEYCRRFFPGHARAVQELRDAILERRRGVEQFLERQIDRYGIDRAEIVGFTSMFGQNVASFAMARMLKQRNPAITTVMGGANCESPMGEEIARNVEAIDYVFSGPGLVSFPDFVQHHVDGTQQECGSIEGVFSSNRPDREPGDRFGKELAIDVEVPLDYEDFFESFERNVPHPRPAVKVSFETSRGCWWGERAHCTFCGLNGQTMGYRAMPPQRAIATFRDLFAKYGTRSSDFRSVDNIMPRNYVKDVLPFIDAPGGAQVFYEVKADLSDDDMRSMAAAGVREIQPGIEALATSTLKLMKKGTAVFQNLRLLKSCLRFGIDPVWNLLVGFPGEGEETYAMYSRNLPSAHHLLPPMGVFPVRFDRYSPYFTKAEEYGLDLKHLDFYPYIYPFEAESLGNLAYYFVNRDYDAPYVKAVAKWIGALRDRIAEWRRLWSRGDGLEPPVLELRRRDGTACVYDSRRGEPVEHELSDVQVRLLGHLESARRERDLAGALGLEPRVVERALVLFDEHQLVWREADRMMSLVMEDADTGVRRTPSR
jgi:ribosomal peptide maturation radical SAM protein 1